MQSRVCLCPLNESHTAQTRTSVPNMLEMPHYIHQHDNVCDSMLLQYEHKSQPRGPSCYSNDFHYYTCPPSEHAQVLVTFPWSGDHDSLHISEHMFRIVKTFRSALTVFLSRGVVFWRNCNNATQLIFLRLNDVSLLVARRMKGNNKNVVKRDRREIAEKKKWGSISTGLLQRINTLCIFFGAAHSTYGLWSSSSKLYNI